VFVQDLVEPSVKQGSEPIEEKPPSEQLVTSVLGSNGDWRDPFIKYLATVDIPADSTKWERLTRRSKHYILVDGKLYKKRKVGNTPKNASLQAKATKY
jgi:hypothetical protein